MEKGTPGFFWLASQGGYGIQTAPALARAAAKLLVDGVLSDDPLGRGLVRRISCRSACATCPAGLVSAIGQRRELARRHTCIGPDCNPGWLEQ
jgi:hypothetical protein